MHLVKMTMKWPSSMIGRGPKMFRYKIHWKLTFKYLISHFNLVKYIINDQIKMLDDDIKLEHT